MFYMKQIDKIVKGIVEPKDINVLWLDTNDPKSPTLKAYADGEWKAISSGEGGGGSAEGAVSYNEQALTEEQQMQARKNQGLYYSTVGNVEKTAYFPQDNLKNQTWAYTLTDEQIASLTAGADFSTFIKVSDDCPQKEELVSLRVNNIDISLLDPNNIVFSGDSVVGYIKQETGYYYGVASEWGEDFFDAIFLVVTDDNVNNIELTGIHSVDGEGYAVANNLSKGIWAKLMVTPHGSSEESDWDIDFIGFSQFVYNGEVEQIVGVETKYTKAISYSEQQDLSVTQQMQARINQGLYAEIKSTETIYTWDGETTGKDVFGDYYYKISDDVNNDTAELIRYIAAESNQID